MKEIVIFLSILIVTIQASDHTSCNLKINRDFSHHQPLVLKQIEGSNEYEFDYPKQGDSLTIESDENILFACPGNGFNQNNNSVVKVKCVEDTKFRSENNNEEEPFEDYECLRLPQSTLEKTGQCAMDKIAYKIGFKVEEVFVKTIDLCFDENEQSAVYAKHKIIPYIEGSQKSFKRIPFRDGHIFTSISANHAYKRENQIAIFADQSISWIHEHINMQQFIARGHFSPVGDFVYGTQQSSTFYYANAAPQWQSFNSGNWNQLEMAVRRLSVKKNLELTVYTGTYGIYELDGKKRYLIYDASGKPSIPIPLVFWKVVYDQEHNKAVAFIGLNDPDADPEDNPAKEMCTDVCPSIKWVSLKPKPHIGLIYCCAVEEFSKIVTTLPPITDDMDQLSLLDYDLPGKKL